MPADLSDYIVMRDGSALAGTLREKKIRFKPLFQATPLEIKVARIVTLVFKHTGAYPEDRVQLRDGGELRGTVVDKEWRFASEDSGAVVLRTKDMLALHHLEPA
jgi:hypothetical protein